MDSNEAEGCMYYMLPFAVLGLITIVVGLLNASVIVVSIGLIPVALFLAVFIYGIFFVE